MVLVDAAVHVTICCVTDWTDMQISSVTSEFVDVSLHNWAFYFVRSSHSSIARSKNEWSCTSTLSYASQIQMVVEFAIGFLMTLRKSLF